MNTDHPAHNRSPHVDALLGRQRGLGPSCAEDELHDFPVLTEVVSHGGGFVSECPPAGFMAQPAPAQPAPAPAASPAVPVTVAELEALIRRVLREELARR